LLNPYRTSDDRWILLVAAQPKDWPGFAQAINRPELLTDPRFADAQTRAAHAADLVEVLDPMFASRPLAEWKRILANGRVIFGVVQIAEEIVNDPQMLANEILVPLAEPSASATHTVNSPVRVEGVRKTAPRRAPELGEHSLQVLRELAFTDAEIDGMRTRGTVVAP